MVHECQRLPCGLKPGDDLFGIHPQLDDLDGDATTQGLSLFSSPDRTEAALAEFFEELIVTDDGADAFSVGTFSERARRSDANSLRKKTPGLFVRGDESFNPSPQGSVARAGTGQERGTLVRLKLQRLVEQRFGRRAVGLLVLFDSRLSFDYQR